MRSTTRIYCSPVIVLSCILLQFATEAFPQSFGADRSFVLRSESLATGLELPNSAGSPPPHETVSQYLKGFAHFASGAWVMMPLDGPPLRGAWETIYSFRNDSATEATATLRFFSPSGQLLPMPIRGTSSPTADYTFTIPPDGSREVELDYAAEPVKPNAVSVSTGWAAFICDNPAVKGQAFFTDYRFKTDGGVESKLTNVVPLTSLASPACLIPLPGTPVFSMPFSAVGMESSYAFANTKQTPVTLLVKFYDQQGTYLGAIERLLPGFGQVSFGSTDVLHSLENKKGSMRVEGDGVIPLGFRFDTGTFTTLMP